MILYWGLGSHLGRPVPQKVDGGLLYSVRDEGYNLERDFGAAGVRTSKTTAGFNFHTDSPSLLAGYTPDIVCLLALQSAKSGGESAILSANTVHNILLVERPEYLERLYAPYHVDRRAELPPASRPRCPRPCSPMTASCGCDICALHHEGPRSGRRAIDSRPIPIRWTTWTK